MILGLVTTGNREHLSVCARTLKVAGKRDARSLPVQTEAPQRFSSNSPVMGRFQPSADFLLCAGQGPGRAVGGPGGGRV